MCNSMCQSEIQLRRDIENIYKIIKLLKNINDKWLGLRISSLDDS